MPLMPVAQVVAQAVAMAQLYDNVLSGTTASWDVQNISQAYNHLRIVLYGRGDNAATETTVSLRFNNDSAANYDWSIAAFTNASTVSANSAASAAQISGVVLPGATAPASSFGSSTFDIPAYAGTVGQKNVQNAGWYKRNTTAADFITSVGGGIWRSTSAINRIQIIGGTGSFIAGSRLTIYGLL
jgi:hypothetical protein